MAPRFAFPVFASFLLAASVASADPPSTPLPTTDLALHGVTPTAPRPNSADREANFAALVGLGDDAFKAGKLPEAVYWYESALEYHPDPLVDGRLGLVYFASRQRQLDAIVANYLYVAVLRGVSADKDERKQMWEVYDTVVHRVCRLSVAADVVDAEIQLDDVPFRSSISPSWTFITPGKHIGRSRLRNHPDIEKKFDCITNEDVNVRFEFEPKPNSEPSTQISFSASPIKIINVRTQPEPKAAASTPAAPSTAATGGFFDFGVGAAMVAGVAPSLSLGATLIASYRREDISFMVGARGAWALGDVANTSIDIASLSGFGGPCTHIRWLGACTLVSINAIRFSDDSDVTEMNETHNLLIPGLGIGFRGDLLNRRGISLRVLGDLTFLSQDVAINYNRPNGVVPVWNGGKLVASISTMIVF